MLSLVRQHCVGLHYLYSKKSICLTNKCDHAYTAFYTLPFLQFFFFSVDKVLYLDCAPPDNDLPWKFDDYDIL